MKAIFGTALCTIIVGAWLFGFAAGQHSAADRIKPVISSINAQVRLLEGLCKGVGE